MILSIGGGCPLKTAKNYFIWGKDTSQEARDRKLAGWEQEPGKQCSTITSDVSLAEPFLLASFLSFRNGECQSGYADSSGQRARKDASDNLMALFKMHVIGAFREPYWSL